MEELVLQLSKVTSWLLSGLQSHLWLVPGVTIAVALLTIARKWLINLGKRVFRYLKVIFSKYFQQRIKLIWQPLIAWQREVNLRLTAPEQYQYYRSLRATCHQANAKGVNIGLPVRDLEAVFVPPQFTIVSAATVPKIQELSLRDLLSQMQEVPAYRCVTILAPSGSGKTTLLRYLTLINCCFEHSETKLILPIILNVRDVGDRLISEPNLTLPQVIKQIYQDFLICQKSHFSAAWFETQLTQGQALVMLDSWEEILNPSQHQQLAQWLNQQIQIYAQTAFILTSLPDAYFQTPVEQITTVLAIEPFNLKQIEQFSQCWYWQAEMSHQNGRSNLRLRAIAEKKAQDLLKLLTNDRKIAAMASHPFLLNMMATLHFSGETLPQHQSELYAQICYLQLKKNPSRSNLAPLTIPQQQWLLELLALELTKHQEFEFSLQKGQLLLKNNLAQFSLNLDSAHFLHYLTDSGLLVESKPDIYQFTHIIFQQYLAATQISQSHQEHLLMENLAAPWWLETICFYAADHDLTNLLMQALQEPKNASLKLVWNCLQDGVTVNTQIRQQLEKKIRAGLETNESKTFELAAQLKLAQRLEHLVPIDANVEIDPHYLTNAEYQLFIDEKRKYDEHRQPDHWTSNRFTPGTANQPIIGVRATDAEDFCQWLTQWRAEAGYRYRLPTLKEAETYPALQTEIACWCNDGDNKALIGIDPTQWQVWKQQLVKILADDPAGALIGDRLFELDLALVLGRSLDLDHALTLARKIAFDLGREPIVHQSLDSVVTRAYARALVDRDLSFSYAHELVRNLESALDLSRDLERDVATIGSYLLLVSGFWYHLAAIYLEIANNRQRLHQLKLSRPECEESSREFARQGDEAFYLYLFFVLSEERRAGRMPVWEGIRIVREKVSKLPTYL